MIFFCEIAMHNSPFHLVLYKLYSKRKRYLPGNTKLFVHEQKSCLQEKSFRVYFYVKKYVFQQFEVSHMYNFQARRRAKSLHSGDFERHSKLELLKETSNKIGHGPEYASHHKEHKQQMFNHKGSNKHVWAKKKKGGFTKKSKLGQ